MTDLTQEVSSATISSPAAATVWRAEDLYIASKTGVCHIGTTLQATPFVAGTIELSGCKFHGAPLDFWFAVVFIYVGFAVLAGRHFK